MFRKFISIYYILICFALVVKAKDNNLYEFNKSILNLENKIYSIPGYIVDTTGIYWSATDPSGYYSFEGYKRILQPEETSYILKLKSYFTSSDYFNKQPKISYSYKNKNDTLISETLNCGTESFYKVPFNFNNIKMIYKEKTFYFTTSNNLVFDRGAFEEFYIILYKNGSRKKVIVDNRDRTFKYVKW